MSIARRVADVLRDHVVLELEAIDRTCLNVCRRTGGTYPWIVESTTMVNHYYFYCVDEDFGPFFLKFCSRFPYNAKLCINGHEYLQRQLATRGGRVRGAG